MENMNKFVKALLTTMNETKLEDKGLPLEIALETFITFKSNKVRTSTINFYKIHLKQIFEYLKKFKIYDTTSIDKKILTLYQHYELNKGLQPQTINKRTRCLLIMLKELKELEFITYQIIDLRQLPERQKQIEIVLNNDIEKVIQYSDTLQDNANLCLKLLITTGIRTNELIQIKNCNINIEEKYILLEDTKNGYTRVCPLVNEIIPLIKKVMSKRKYLFSKEDTEHFKNSFVRSIIARAKKALNIKVLSPHKLRHSFATYHCKNGTNLKVVQELLGHRSILMTQKYIDIDKEDLIIANNNCNMLNKSIKKADTRLDTL